MPEPDTTGRKLSDASVLRHDSSSAEAALGTEHKGPADTLVTGHTSSSLVVSDQMPKTGEAGR